MQQTQRTRHSPARYHVNHGDAPAEQSKAPAKKARGFHWDRLLPVLFGIFVLGLWWIAGARWTIDGSPLVMNAVFDFLHLSIVLPRVARWEVYAMLCWLPVGISYMEHKYAPWRLEWNGAILVGIFLALVWLVVTGADWSSTYMALLNPDPGAWRIALQVAALPPLAAIIATVTTFVPEFGIAVLIWWLWE